MSQNQSGEIFGGTRRPDGSLRKTVKIRPGYVAPEQQSRYSVREMMEQKRKQREKQAGQIKEKDNKAVLNNADRQNTGPQSGSGKNNSDTPAIRHKRGDPRFQGINDILSSNIYANTSSRLQRRQEARQTLNNDATSQSSKSEVDSDLNRLTSDLKDLSVKDSRLPAHQSPKDTSASTGQKAYRQKRTKQEGDLVKDFQSDNGQSRSSNKGKNGQHNHKKKLTLEELDKQMEEEFGSK